MIVSDRQKGRLAAFAQVFNTVRHTPCVTHIVTKVGKKFKEYRTVQTTIRDAAKTLTKYKFDKAMTFIGGINKEILNYVVEADAKA